MGHEYFVLFVGSGYGYGYTDVNKLIQQGWILVHMYEAIELPRCFLMVFAREIKE